MSLSLQPILILNQSGVFSIIFAMCLRGLGAHTKTGSAFMTAAISGGAVFPVIMNAVQRTRGVQYSYSVVVAVFAFGALFPIYLNLLPPAKRQVDPVTPRRSTLNMPTTASRRASRALGGMFKRKNHSADLPSTEHVEGNNLAPWPDDKH